MPELPEVETTKRGIEPLVVGKIVERVVVHNPSLRWPIPAELETVLLGERVLSIDRRSKYLLLSFAKGTLIIHLGMTGHLRCDTKGIPLRKHDHVEIVFADNSVLRFNDSRRFGAMLWTQGNPLQHERLAKLGPEPFNDFFNVDYIYTRSRNRKVPVKQFLMDAHIVVGVGNIYASEALFRAGIKPSREAGKIGKQAYARLIVAVRDILAEAIDAGGTTIRDFADSEGKPGYFKQELRVYGRAGATCTACNSIIKQTKLGQRSTYYCPKCQR